MAHVLADRVKDTATTTGTGDFTVSGSPPSGFQTFDDVLDASDTFFYAIVGGAEWEVGLGTYEGSHVFERTTVLASSNAGSAVDFSAGAKSVWLDHPASALQRLGTSDTPTFKGITLTGGTVTVSTPLLDQTQTWNNSGVTFTALSLAVTDTASAAASLLANWTVGGTSQFSVTKGGVLTARARVLVAAGGGAAAPNFGWGTSGFYLTHGSGDNIYASVGGTYRGGFFATGWQNANALHFGWESAGAGSAADLTLFRDAADVFAQRRTTNAQTFRLYRTWTDASNYERLALQTGSGYIQLAAETAGTGADDLDVYLLPAGAGLVRFGSHSAIGAETVTGYITIKDAGGTSRKIAVVS